MIAQKFYDEPYLSNGQFSHIYPFFTTNDINRLEKRFLELINYDVYVKPIVYIKYYFELTGFSSNQGKESRVVPMNLKEQKDSLNLLSMLLQETHVCVHYL